MAERVEVQGRLHALRKLLLQEQASTQDELRGELEKMSYEVNQSTISRDLRKLGAIKLTNPSGQTVYRLAEDVVPNVTPPGLDQLIRSIDNNGYMIVIRTSPGSASFVARTVDQLSADHGVMGTIAGDDTIFVVPKSPRQILNLQKKIEAALQMS